MKKKLLIFVISISISHFALPKSIIHISGKSDMKVYYEYEDISGDLLHPIFTSSTTTLSSGTGPSQPPIDFNQYGYFETSKNSNGVFYRGDKSVLSFESSNTWYQSTNNKSLSFYYHMYGSDIGKIEVQRKRYLASGGSYWETTKTISGQQHTSSDRPWNFLSMPINYDYGLHSLRIKMTAVGGYRGDISIAGIKITSREDGLMLPYIDLVQGNNCKNYLIGNQGSTWEDGAICKSSYREYAGERYSAMAGDSRYQGSFRVNLSQTEPSASTNSFSTHYHDKSWGYSFSIPQVIGNSRIQIQSRPYTECNSSYTWEDVYTTESKAKVFVVDAARVMNDRNIGCLSEEIKSQNRLMFRFRLVDGSTIGKWTYLRPMLMRRD